MTSGQVTTLLSNSDLDRLARLRINANRRFTNRSRGEHFAGKGGMSTEFCDYRDYVEGDDMRFVDWNIFSRLHRPYLKIFHQEEELHVVILVDASTSMQFEEKLARAKQLAAAFGVCGLRSGERVSVHAFRSAGAQSRLAPCRGGVSMSKLFGFLENLQEGGDVPLEQGVEQMLRHHSGRGVCVLLSDFLSSGDLKRSFNFLHGSGLEIFAVQILAPSEIDPGISGDLRLVDSELGLTLDISSASDLLTFYQEHRAAFENELTTLCRQRSGRFLSVSSADPIEWLLFDEFRRKGWLV